MAAEPHADLPRLLDGAMRGDCSVGSRWVPGGGTENWSLLRKAISRGGYALVATGLQHCLADGGLDTVDAQRMEKLFLSLA